MTRDLLGKYYNIQELDSMLNLLALEVGAVLCSASKRLIEQNENWVNEELVENMIESDNQLMKRFCEILQEKDKQASLHAGQKTREKFGI